jgi:anti-anti-sigma factor
MTEITTTFEHNLFLVKVVGEVDLSNSDRLSQAIADVLGGDRQSSCLLDLSETTFIDSTVLRVLLKWSTDVQLSEREALAIVVPDGKSAVYRLFELVGMTSVLHLFPSVATATAALREGQRARGERDLGWLTDAELVTERDDAEAASDAAEQRLTDIRDEQKRRDEQ